MPETGIPQISSSSSPVLKPDDGGVPVQADWRNSSLSDLLEDAEKQGNTLLAKESDKQICNGFETTGKEWPLREFLRVAGNVPFSIFAADAYGYAKGGPQYEFYIVEWARIHARLRQNTMSPHGDLADHARTMLDEQRVLLKPSEAAELQRRLARQVQLATESEAKGEQIFDTEAAERERQRGR